MNEGIRKFRELFLTDEEFQQKLKTALSSYTGEQTEEALFNEVLAPAASEYGITATYEEFHDFITNAPEMNDEDLAQIAGGKTGGAGGGFCFGLGLGLGGGGGDGTGGGCAVIGGGWGTYKCMGEGKSSTLS